MTAPRAAHAARSTLAPRSALYVGTLRHARADAYARRAFAYPVYTASLDLDELPGLDRALRLFSYNRRNLFALRDRDYAVGGGAGLRDGHARLLAAHGLPAAAHARLVTNLAVAGYVFNPVSFFLGYDAAGALTSVVAEVNNTYGGRHQYVLGPDHRLARSGPARAGFGHRRDFFVSPFLHGPRRYELWFDPALDPARLAIAMHVDTPDGARVFSARLDGARRPLTDRALAAAALRYPLMTAQVIGLIHYQALKLHLRGVPYHRPPPDHRPIDTEAPPAPAPSRSAQRAAPGKPDR